MINFLEAPFTADIGYSTVVGGDHNSRGVPNQDAARMSKVGLYVFGAVADGVGNTSMLESSGGNMMPTASGLAVDAFSETVEELLGEHPEGRANLDWALRIGLSAANAAIRKAKEQKALPKSAAATFIGTAGNLMTGEVAAVSLGDSGIAKCTPNSLSNLVTPHVDEQGRLTKTLRGDSEIRVPYALALPAPTERQRIIDYTDGLSTSYRLLRDLEPDLRHLPGFQNPNALLLDAIRRGTAQDTADALTHMATATTDAILVEGGMRPGSDDTSVFVVDMYPALP